MHGRWTERMLSQLFQSQTDGVNYESTWVLVILLLIMCVENSRCADSGHASASEKHWKRTSHLTRSIIESMNKLPNGTEYLRELDSQKAWK